MNKIGIFFGTETGTTRLVTKKMQKRLSDALCDKPETLDLSGKRIDRWLAQVLPLLREKL